MNGKRKPELKKNPLWKKKKKKKKKERKKERKKEEKRLFCSKFILGIRNFFSKILTNFPKKLEPRRRRKTKTFLYKKFMPRNYTSFFCFPKNENKLILSKRWEEFLNLQVLFLNFLLLKNEESDGLKNSRLYLINGYLIRIMTSNFQFF